MRIRDLSKVIQFFVCVCFASINRFFLCISTECLSKRLICAFVFKAQNAQAHIFAMVTNDNGK